MQTLLPLRQVAHRFGGSNAQRDALDQTLLVACEGAGKHAYVQALRAERALLRGSAHASG